MKNNKTNNVEITCKCHDPKGCKHYCFSSGLAKYYQNECDYFLYPEGDCTNEKAISEALFYEFVNKIEKLVPKTNRIDLSELILMAACELEIEINPKSIKLMDIALMDEIEELVKDVDVEGDEC